MAVRACKSTDRQGETLYVQQIASPLGSLLAVADDAGLHLLEFTAQSQPKSCLEQAAGYFQGPLSFSQSGPLILLAQELQSYFNGTLKKFHTPLKLSGTPFQKSVWQALLRVPYGHTRTYQEQATSMGRPSALRAVANGNSQNKIVILVPCHRIIASSGGLGGYSGGLERKRWLLNHESRYHNK